MLQHQAVQLEKSLQTCNSILINYVLDWCKLVTLLLKISPLEAKHCRMFDLVGKEFEKSSCHGGVPENCKRIFR